MMLSNFNKIFDDMVLDRVEELDGLVFANDEYNELENKITNMFYDIKNYLPKEHEKLISRYAEAYALQFALVGKLIYKQGLKDGIEIKKILEIAG